MLASSRESQESVVAGGPAGFERTANVTVPAALQSVAGGASASRRWTLRKIGSGSQRVRSGVSPEVMAYIASHMLRRPDPV